MNPAVTAAGPSPSFEARAACFHCGLPVPGGIDLRATVLGRSREMCCSGCQAVAGTIVAAGFESYYETRDPPHAGDALPAGLPSISIYDDPLAQRQFVARVGGHGRETLLALDGIRCAACAWLNERYLRGLPGVASVSVNYATRRAQVRWDDRLATLGGIIGAVRRLGYDAYPFDAGKQRLNDRKEQRAAIWRLFVAGFGAMQVMMYAVPRYIDDTGTLTAEADQVMRWASLVLTLPVLLFACGPFFSSALKDLRARRPGMDVPVSLGILAGFAASVWATVAGGGAVYFDSITMLVFLLLGARHLESSARRKAAVQLDRLARWMPAFAFRLRPGSGSDGERMVAHDLCAGDRVLVAPGETVPADGILLAGSANVDESLLTGESRPVDKTAGAALIGGSINLSQPLAMRVTAAGLETQAAAIGRLIERAAAGRPRLVEAADRVAQVLTGVVLATAFATLGGWLLVNPSQAAWAAIAVLMVTCPCALGLAAPIVLTSATGALARRGIVLTRGAAIESLAKVTDVVLDKTGTLTEGKYRLAHIELLGDASRDECLKLAQALESGSRHPMANALMAVPCGGAPAGLQGVTHCAGNGIEASIGAKRIRIGSLRFAGGIAGGPAGIAEPQPGESVVYLATESGWLARLQFEDALRSDAAQLVEGLRARGIKIHLVSGDDPAVVLEVARALGLERARGGVLPRDKQEYVASQQSAGARVAMVGDGLNDAPELAQADVSFAMGEGAALAQRYADLVLSSGKLTGALDAMTIATGAMRAIKQNFAWALAYNALALPAAAFGLIGPWEAAIGMAASSFAVVLNSSRFMAAVR